MLNKNPKDMSVQEYYSRWGLTGSKERLALLKEVENLFDNGNLLCKAKMNQLASMWSEELECIFGITDYTYDCADKYHYEILCNCDDEELQAIIDYCNNPKVEDEQSTPTTTQVIYNVIEQFNNNGEWMFNVYPTASLDMAREVIDRLVVAYHKGDVFGDFLNKCEDDITYEREEDAVFINKEFDGYDVNIYIEVKPLMKASNDIPNFLV